MKYWRTVSIKYWIIIQISTTVSILLHYNPFSVKGEHLREHLDPHKELEHEEAT